MPKNLARIQKANKRKTQYGGQYFHVLAPCPHRPSWYRCIKNTLD